jgi:2-hydroxycyclohexanecarboxyl-CoA dehydrogenase
VVTLDGRVAMVTGAGRGIGAAIAARLAKLGASVAVCDIDETTATATAESLDVPAVGLQVDVTDRAAVRAAVAGIGDELGPIDILVNNAGIDVIEPFMDSTEDTWDRLWQVNLKGQIICCHAVLEAYMIPNSRGCIVNLGSDAGRVGSTGEAVYSATKGGVIAFTKTLAREMARNGITVNCVDPGLVATDLMREHVLFRPRWLKAVWGRVLSTPERGARTAIYAASAPELETVTAHCFDRRGRPMRTSRQSRSATTRERLWKMSAEMTGTPPDWP